MKILILGATGFIGYQLASRLTRDGHHVIGMGRSVTRSMTRLPRATWLAVDIGKLQTEVSWIEHLHDCDVIINCAGALQDGLADNVAAVQTSAQLALQKAASRSGIKSFIQISAETGGPAGHTTFLHSKRLADIALAESNLPYVILRPSLVVGRNAFGGTALVRGLAAFPMITPLAFADSTTATVIMDDLETAVVQAINGTIPSGSDISLASHPPPSLEQLVAEHRKWLGLKPAMTVRIPDILARAVSRIADLLGLLGWRSPLRSAALTVMQAGVVAAAQNQPFELESSNAFLQRNPAGIQDIWFGRLHLLKPIIFFTLALFWLMSGIVPLFNPTLAARHLEPVMGESGALALTIATCILDILLAAGLLWRPFTQFVLMTMISVSLIYLAGSLWVNPSLWLDPLGPMVKVLPSIVLTLIALAILDER